MVRLCDGLALQGVDATANADPCAPDHPSVRARAPSPTHPRLDPAVCARAGFEGDVRPVSRTRGDDSTSQAPPPSSTRWSRRIAANSKRSPRPSDRDERPTTPGTSSWTAMISPSSASRPATRTCSASSPTAPPEDAPSPAFRPISRQVPGLPATSTVRRSSWMARGTPSRPRQRPSRPPPSQQRPMARG